MKHSKFARLIIAIGLPIFLFMLILFALPVAPAASQGADDPSDEEGQSEFAGDTEVNAGVNSPVQSTSNGYDLFAGNDTTTLPQVLIDVGTSDFITGFVGIDAWGAAYDSVNGKLYHNDGSDLYEWSPGGTPTLLGTITAPGGGDLTVHGLAFYDGTLYATSISTDEIYTIDLSTYVATTYITLVDTGASISGLAIDPNTGDMYGTDDLSNVALVKINNDGTLTVIAPYLGGETDVDGLAISPGGQAYLITDDPTPSYFNVFDLNVMTYTAVVSYPWGTNSAVQVSGAWVGSAPDPLVCNGAPVAFELGIPSDWTVVVNTGPVYWSTTDDLAACDNGGNQTQGSGNAACADSDETNPTGLPYDTELWSNSFDLSGYNAVSLDFAAYYNDIGGADTFEVWVWDGGNWNQELIWDEDHDEIASMDLSAYGGLSDVAVSYRYQGDGWDWFAQIDDVSLSCAIAPVIDVDPSSLENEQPKDTQDVLELTISNLGLADLNWTIDEEPTAVQPAVTDPDSIQTERLGATRPVERAAGDELQSGSLNGDIIQDGGFEAGTPNPYWNESSTNFGTPLCDVPSCGQGGGTGPHGGAWWAWFGGISGVIENGSVDQDVVIPNGTAMLSYWLEIPVADTTGFLNVEIDGNVLATYTEADQATYAVYQEVTLDVSAYADGGSHNLAFVSTTDAGTGPLNFFIDDVVLNVGGEPAVCDNPADIPWVSASPAAGTTTPGNSTIVDVTFDSTGLATGIYTGTLCVFSDDPINPVVPVPLTMTVASGNTFLPFLDAGDSTSASNFALPLVPLSVLLTLPGAAGIRQRISSRRSRSEGADS